MAGVFFGYCQRCKDLHNKTIELHSSFNCDTFICPVCGWEKISKNTTAFNFVKRPIVEVCDCGMTYIHHFEHAQYNCVRCGKMMEVVNGKPMVKD